ncbi:MAG: hypothetical protein J6S00_05520 [Clostridia bacterium]|nr:hypothetical protein [Clostridia bacterium]
MKKIIGILLVLCICFGMCACGGDKATSSDNGTAGSSNPSASDNGSSEGGSSSSGTVSGLAEQVFASARTYSKNGVATKRTLDNTVYKLKKNKKLNVLYFGGSVTSGVGSTGDNSWAKQSEKWLKETYPDAEINITNSAIGGTGVYYGVFRADSYVFAHKPDLIFIEFALNDAYEGFYYAQSAYYMEMLIKTINQKLPQTDVIILLTTDKGKVGEEYEEMAAHKAVAEHYGIPWIDLGAELAKTVKAGSGNWEDYILDWAHPNDKGYAAYSTAVINGLKSLLSVDGKALKNHTLPKEDFIVGGINMNYRVIAPKDLKVDSNWNVGSRKVHAFTSVMRPTVAGSTCTIEFEGNSFGMYIDCEKGNTVVATIDGKEKKTFVNPDDEGGNEKLIFDNLAPGKHQVEIKYNGTSKFYIYGIFIG